MCIRDSYNRGCPGSSYADNATTNTVWIYNADLYADTLIFKANPVPADLPMPGGVIEISNKFCADDRIANMLPPDSDCILVMGGLNDYFVGWGMAIGDMVTPYNTATIKGAVSSTLTKIQNKCPNAQIIVLGPTYNSSVGDTHYNDFYAMVDAIKDVAGRFGIPFIDTCREQGINALNLMTYTDSVHPNALGAKKLAKLVISKLKGLDPIS